MQFLTFVIISIAAVISVSAAPSEQDVYSLKQKVSNACKKELKSSDEAAKIFVERRSAKNEEEKCLLECAYKKAGLLKDDKVQPGGADKYAEQKFAGNEENIKKAKALFKTCGDKLAADNVSGHCAKASHLRDCFMDNQGELEVF